MKRTALILILLLVMAGSLTAGTLAMYTTSIDSLAQGSVVAKEFIFTGDGHDSFAQGVKIAPEETVTWQFNVKNYSGHIVTETDLYYKLNFHIQASAGKTAIEPMTVTVKDESGNTVGSATGVGVFSVLGQFPLSENGQEKTYTLELYWPSNDGINIDYAGNQFGTMVNINAIASQVPLPGSEPTTPPQTSAISVLYQTTSPWQIGQDGINRFNYSMTITNQSDQPVNDWYIDFALPQDTLTSVWSNAKMSQGLPSGTYRFVNPGYNNAATDNLLPGQSVTFGGQGYGLGESALQNVQVGGSNTEALGAVLTCEFGSLS